MSTIEKPYGRRDRPGFKAARANKGHPKRQARRDRAYARGGTKPA